MKIRFIHVVIICILSFKVFAKQQDLNIFQTLQSGTWINQNAVAIKIDESNKKLRYGFVLSFTNCPTLCPMIAHDLKEISSQVKNLKIFLISIKPDEDQPEALKSYLEKRKLSESIFEFIKSNQQKTQELAESIGLKYSNKEMNGHTDHSTSLVFVNGFGKKIGQVDLSNGVDKKTLSNIKKILR